MSGAGKTSVLKALEDLGFEAVDNLPLKLLPNLIGPTSTPDAEPVRPLAVGVDVRTRDFAAANFTRDLAELKARPDVDVSVLFVDCADDTLMGRYSETRHRHPLALDRPVIDGIKLERREISPLRDLADIVLDTTGRAPGTLKPQLSEHFASTLMGENAAGLTVFVTSFAYRRGLPSEADLVFDVRFLQNPHYDPALKELTGLDDAVARMIEQDPDYAAFFDGLKSLIRPLLPRYASEGKSYLTIAVGCTGGRHRSVFMAERLAGWLADEGERVRLSHRELELVANAAKEPN